MNAHTPIPSAPKRFRIDWAVELDASSPYEAACFAAELQDQDSTATIFSVEDLQTRQISVHDLTLDGVPGENIIARRPEDTTFVARTLRVNDPTMTFRTRSGIKAVFVDSEEHAELGVVLHWHNEQGGPLVTTLKTGRFSPTGEDHELDVFEANPPVTKWLRMYDRKLNEAGKQVVGGKEYAAERGLFLYLFDTEAEARANLQGVRAVFPITYRDGDGLG